MDVKAPGFLSSTGLLRRAGTGHEALVLIFGGPSRAGDEKEKKNLVGGAAAHPSDEKAHLGRIVGRVRVGEGGHAPGSGQSEGKEDGAPAIEAHRRFRGGDQGYRGP